MAEENHLRYDGYVALCTVQRRHKTDAVDRLYSKIYSTKVGRKQVYLWIGLWVQLTLMDWPFGIIRKIFTSLHTVTGTGCGIEIPVM